MKKTTLLICSLMLSLNVMAQATSASNTLRRLLTAAAESEDNIARESVQAMESKLLKELKANPSKFGLSDEAAKDLKRLEDLKSERVMAEILKEAPDMLKLGYKARAATRAIQEEAGVISSISHSGQRLKVVQLANSEQTHFGQQISLRIKNLEEALVAKGLNPRDAKIIRKDTFNAAAELWARAGNDKQLQKLSKDILDREVAIMEYTGKPFMGKGGCANIRGREVLENKAEIALKTLTDVKANKLTEFDDIGHALQRNYGKVTMRSEKKACLALQALASATGECKVYAAELAPKDC